MANDSRIEVRLPAIERERIAKVAEEAGESSSEWLRRSSELRREIALLPDEERRLLTRTLEVEREVRERVERDGGDPDRHREVVIRAREQEMRQAAGLAEIQERRGRQHPDVARILASRGRPRLTAPKSVRSKRRGVTSEQVRADTRKRERNRTKVKDTIASDSQPRRKPGDTERVEADAARRERARTSFKTSGSTANRRH